MHKKLTSLLLAAVLAALLVPRALITADAPANLDPQKIFAATLNRSIIGEKDDPATLRALLDLGQVILIDRHTSGVPWLISAGALMDAPIEKSYEAIADVPRLPEFMPQTEGAKAVEIAPNLYAVELTVVVRIVYIPIKETFKIYQFNQPPRRIDWASQEPQALIDTGYWQMAPTDHNARTMGFYSIYSRANEGMMKKLFDLDPALEMLVDMSTGTLCARATKTRAELLHQRAGGSPPPPPPAPARSVLAVMQKDPAAVAALAAKGRLMVIEPQDTVWSNVVAVFNLPPDQVRQKLIDVEAQTKCDPRVKVTVTNRDDKSMTVKYNLAFSLVVTVNTEYTLKYDISSPNHLSWETVPPAGSIKGVRGSWDLIPVDNGAHTLALYRTTSDLKSAGAVVQSILKIEPTFELAIQASQSLVAVDNLEKCMIPVPK
jgi:ribosome-associated toxin RatA of RatAB toxin-antitoxin module